MRRRSTTITGAALCAALALPAAAQANRFYKPGWEAHAALKSTAANHKGPSGRMFLRQHEGALTVALRVGGLARWSRHTADIHQGSCAAPGASVLAFPDLIADGRGVAKLWITLPTGAGKDYAENGLFVDVHRGFGASAGAAVTCGNIKENTAFGRARVRPVNGSHASGAVRLRQKGDKVDVWLDLKGLTPNSTHAEHIHAGSCAAQGPIALVLPDITADTRGRVKIHLSATAPTGLDVVTSGYYYQVHQAASPTFGAGVACGNVVAAIQTRKHRPWPNESDPWWWRWWFA